MKITHLIILLLPLISISYFCIYQLSRLSDVTPIRRVGFFIMGTGKYLKLVEQLIRSLDDHFCVNNKQIYVNYFVFTDNKTWTPVAQRFPSSNRQFRIIYRQNQNWTLNTLLRFEMILKIYDSLNLHAYDFLYWLDADMKMVDAICEDIFGDRVGTMHADYHTSEKVYPYESRNKNSTAYILPKLRYEHPYYVGSFFGGNSNEMKKLMTKCHQNIQFDLRELNFIARVQDESHLNKLVKRERY